jgi:type IV secretory pathway TraG/TraD family ATPase VirD4
VRRALLTSDEVRRLPSDRQILFKAGAPPIFARKLRYYADYEFRGLLHDGAKGIAFAGADAAHS